MLGGVLSGTFMNFQSVHVGSTGQNHTHALSTSALGIAAVVPGHLLEELLTGLDAQKQRADLAERLQKLVAH